jgi:hypothetical protein
MINYADYKIKVNDHPEGPSKICQLGGDRTILPLLEKIELVDFKEDKGKLQQLSTPINLLINSRVLSFPFLPFPTNIKAFSYLYSFNKQNPTNS